MLHKTNTVNQMEPTIKIGQNEVRDSKFLTLLMEKAGLSYAEATQITTYNVISPQQLADLTNRSISAIQNKMKPIQTPNGLEAELTKTWPWAFKDKVGPVFIHFDEKCKTYIEKTLLFSHGRTISVTKDKGESPRNRQTATR